MARDDALRIQVRLTADLHPELFAALADIQPRGRAERLRQLALLGLSGARCAGVGRFEATAARDAAADERADPLDPKRARILGALTLAD